MKANMKNLILVSSLMTIGLLTACGSSKSNPLEKYDGIKGIPAETNEKSPQQTALAPQLFTVQVEGDNKANVGHFIEGQESQVLIKVTPRTASIQTYTVQLIDFTTMERPTISETGTPGVYSLNWHPPVGTIASGFQQSFKAKIQVLVTKASNSLLEEKVTTTELDVSVSRDTTPPKIMGNSLPKLVEEGQETAFSIDVADPAGLTNPRLPEIMFPRYISANTEAYRADGSRFIDLDETREINPERNSSGTYRFYYKLTPEQLPLDRDRRGRPVPSASEVDMCFYVQVMGVSKIPSDQIQLCTKARYAVQAPTITFDETSLTNITAGKEVLINVKVSSAHSKSVIVIMKPSLLIAGLTGQKEVNCNFETAEAKNSQVCVVKWTPACVSSTTSVALTVKADSNLGNKVKSSSLIKTVSVQPSVDCPVFSSKPARTVKRGNK